jgi:hypothetical protein
MMVTVAIVMMVIVGAEEERARALRGGGSRVLMMRGLVALGLLRGRVRVVMPSGRDLVMMVRRGGGGVVMVGRRVLVVEVHDVGLVPVLFFLAVCLHPILAIK